MAIEVHAWEFPEERAKLEVKYSENGGSICVNVLPLEVHEGSHLFSLNPSRQLPKDQAELYDRCVLYNG